MFTRRGALSGVALAALAAHTPTSAADRDDKQMVPCCHATVFSANIRSRHGLLFDLPQGLFLVDHAALYYGRFVSAKDGSASFITDGDIHRGIELEVPRSFLDAALALHAANEVLLQHQDPIWQYILKANGYGPLPQV